MQPIGKHICNLFVVGVMSVKGSSNADLNFKCSVLKIMCCLIPNWVMFFMTCPSLKKCKQQPVGCVANRYVMHHVC